MATAIGALRVELSANIAKFEAAMGKAAKNMARTQRSFERFGSQATAAGQSLSIGLTAPLVGIGVGALRSSVAFESAFAGVIKTVDDATDGMGRLTPVGEALQQGFRDLSLQIPIAATELAGIGEVAGQLGIESENILGFTEVMAKLGVTTNLSAEEAATSLAQLANITSLPQTEFERLGSTVVALGNNLATNEAQIVDFGKRIASAGTIAGLTEPQILAIGGAMASVGVESEAGGTAVQKVLNAMTKSVAQGGEKLEIFARTARLSAAEFQRAFREDAAGAFASFVTGLGQQGDAAFTTLDGLTLGNERVVRSFLSLAAKSTTLTDALALGTTAWEENTALAREADIRFQTTASQLKLLANQVVEAGRALGDILKPILQTVVGIVRDQVVPWLKTVVDRFKALSPEVQTSRILWLGFAAALGPALIAIGDVARALTPLVPLFGRIWIAAGRMANALVQPKVTARALSARLVTLRASLAGLSLSARASAGGREAGERRNDRAALCHSRRHRGTRADDPGVRGVRVRRVGGGGAGSRREAQAAGRNHRRRGRRGARRRRGIRRAERHIYPDGGGRRHARASTGPDGGGHRHARSPTWNASVPSWPRGWERRVDTRVARPGSVSAPWTTRSPLSGKWSRPQRIT